SPQPRTLVRWTQNVFELSSPDLPSTKNPGHPRGTSAWRTAVLKLEICSSARRSPSSTPATRESLDSPLTFDQPRRPSYTHVHMGGCSWRWARRSSSMGVIAAGGVDGGGGGAGRLVQSPAPTLMKPRNARNTLRTSRLDSKADSSWPCIGQSGREAS